MSGKENDGPRWYTIREAAEYLSIGEPTLYRWMRDKKITYRKVGDSTRFLREDLEAFVQVHPSERDAASVKEVCPVCHNDELVAGDFRTTGLNYFKPKKTSFWRLKGSFIKSEARMCARCGAITLFGDVASLERLKQESPEPASES